MVIKPTKRFMFCGLVGLVFHLFVTSPGEDKDKMFFFSETTLGGKGHGEDKMGFP